MSHQKSSEVTADAIVAALQALRQQFITDAEREQDGSTRWVSKYGKLRGVEAAIDCVAELQLAEIRATYGGAA